jgi:hypothetical protein
MFIDLAADRPTVTIHIDGLPHIVSADLSVAAALLSAGVFNLRDRSFGGAQGPFCMMGVCFECLCTIDGQPNRQACLETVSQEMVIVTRPAAAAEDQS